MHTDSKQFLKVQVGINKQPHLRYEGYSFHLIFRPDPFQQSGSEKAGRVGTQGPFGIRKPFSLALQIH